MNVACTACPAKYAVPDDKVRGKRARITCKHCGTAIILDGTTLDSDGSSSESSGLDAPTSVRRDERVAATPESPASQRPPGDGPWVIALGEGRQESASIPRIVELYGQGVIDRDTYLWREGMSGWKTPFEVPQIEAALRARSFFPEVAAHPPIDDDDATQIVPAPSEGKKQRSLPRLGEDDDGVTVARDSHRLHGRMQLEPPRSYEPAPASEHGRRSQNGSSSVRGSRPRASTRVGLGPPASARSSVPSRQSSAIPAADLEDFDDLAVTRGTSSRPPPFERPSRQSVQSADSGRAARRADGRVANGGGEDLFAARAFDGSEEDPTLGLNAAPPPIGPRMTGARNESSVLFSLDALARKEPERPRAPAYSPELILAPPPPPPPRSHQQPGPAAMGPFMSSLAAPDFTAPPRSERPPPVMPAVVTPARQPAFQQTSFDASDFAYPHPKRRWGRVAGALLLVGGGTAAAFAIGIPQKYMAHSAPPGAAVQAAQPPQERPTPVTPTAEPTRTPPAEPEAPAEGATATGTAPAEPKAETATPTPQPAQRAAWSSSQSARSTGASERSSGSSERSTRSAESEEEDDGSAAAIEIRTPSSLNDAIAAEAKGSDSAKPSDTEATIEVRTPAPDTSGGAFDRAAAVTALGSAATSAQSCKMLGGPTGTGQAMVTFAPSGRVTSASVSGDFAGSTVGGCVARLFRNARVPAFSGEAVTVKKSFSIE